eukprot:35184-Eustigmatos_ZCMA.PRE.1
MQASALGTVVLRPLRSCARLYVSPGHTCDLRAADGGGMAWAPARALRVRWRGIPSELAPAR